jgi:CRP-like cAMP-binding protein
VLEPFSSPNRILARLPRGEFERLLPALELVTLRFGQVINRFEEPIRHVYFPYDCMISLMTPIGDRQISEVGLVGKEGLIGVQVALGAKLSPFQSVVQGGGTAMRLASSRLTREMRRNGALSQEVYKFAHLLMIQLGQTVGCNRYHPVSQRLARWLLMTRDRINANEFRLTHQFLAFMLGVQRPRVSAVAVEFKRKRLIRYSRGRVTILDEKGLLAASCACYDRVKSAYRDA